MAHTPPLSVPQLVSALRDTTFDTPEQLRGALEGLFVKELGAPAARSIASTIVDDHVFDTTEVLVEVTPKVLSEISIPAGLGG